MILRPRQTFGKYKIQRRIAQGGFADVYRAFDTIEGIPVAIKVPHRALLVDKTLDDCLREVRLTSKLDHPNILHIKNANYISGQFFIVYPLGEGTLADKMSHRLTFDAALDYAHQMLDGVAYAHRKRVMRCDIKPENLILFSGNLLKLADFGIAKIATRTVSASGSGTVGYIAPEQALGKPSLRSDVFSMGLVIYQMLTNRLPEWPFDWPPPGHDILRRKANNDFIAVIKRAMNINARKRYANAGEMLAAFERVRKNAHRRIHRRRTKRPATNGAGEWRQVQFKEFKRLYGKSLETTFECSKCGGPVSERMVGCPWCGHRTKSFRGETSYPARCRSCKRGMKLDWRYCPHEYGSAQGPRSDRSYTDKRYTSSCSNPSCREPLMPFMKYCPWCRTRVRRKWKVEGSAKKCPKCGWGVAEGFWAHCPWCTHKLRK